MLLVRSLGASSKVIMTVAIKPDRLSTVTKRKYQKYVARLKKSKGGVEQSTYHIVISIVISIFVKMSERYFHLFHNFNQNAIHGKDDSSWWLITTVLPGNDSVEGWQLSPQLWCWSMLIITITITIMPFCHCPHKYDVDWWWWSSQSPLIFLFFCRKK